MRVVVMVPTYNEVENIGLMLEALANVAQRHPTHVWQILVIDDTSPDGTADVVRSFMETHQNIYLDVGKKEGLGSAMIRGYMYAMAEIEADVVVSIDADFLFDPYDIPVLLERIEDGADVVIGSRHNLRGFRVAGWPMSRYVTHWIANTLFARWVAGGYEIHDHNSNFRAIRIRGVLDSIDWAGINVRGYGFINFMSYLLARKTNKFAEVEVLMKWRELGESKVSFNPKYVRTFLRDSFEYVLTCFIIRFYRLFDV